MHRYSAVEPVDLELTVVPFTAIYHRGGSVSPSYVGLLPLQSALDIFLPTGVIPHLCRRAHRPTLWQKNGRGNCIVVNNFTSVVCYALASHGHD